MLQALLPLAFLLELLAAEDFVPGVSNFAPILLSLCFVKQEFLPDNGCKSALPLEQGIYNIDDS